MAIDSKLMLDNVLEYLRELMKTSDKEKLSVETLQMIKRLRKEYKEEKIISFDSAADAQRWMDSL